MPCVRKAVQARSEPDSCAIYEGCVAGEGWRAAWMERLENWQPPASHIWMKHQRRDAYWKHGSVCEAYDDITCAVYAVGGWQDGYSNAVPRLLANLSAPAKGLIGPWGHKYPHDGIPGPAIGFLQEALRGGTTG